MAGRVPRMRPASKERLSRFTDSRELVAALRSAATDDPCVKCLTSRWTAFETLLKQTYEADPRRFKWANKGPIVDAWFALLDAGVAVGSSVEKDLLPAITDAVAAAGVVPPDILTARTVRKKLRDYRALAASKVDGGRPAQISEAHAPPIKRRRTSGEAEQQPPSGKQLPYFASSGAPREAAWKASVDAEDVSSDDGGPEQSPAPALEDWDFRAEGVNGLRKRARRAGLSIPESSDDPSELQDALRRSDIVSPSPLRFVSAQPAGVGTIEWSSDIPADQVQPVTDDGGIPLPTCEAFVRVLFRVSTAARGGPVSTRRLRSLEFWPSGHVCGELEGSIRVFGPDENKRQPHQQVLAHKTLLAGPGWQGAATGPAVAFKVPQPGDDLKAALVALPPGIPDIKYILLQLEGRAFVGKKAPTASDLLRALVCRREVCPPLELINPATGGWTVDMSGGSIHNWYHFLHNVKKPRAMAVSPPDAAGMRVWRAMSAPPKARNLTAKKALAACGAGARLLYGQWPPIQWIAATPSSAVATSSARGLCARPIRVVRKTRALTAVTEDGTPSGEHDDVVVLGPRLLGAQRWFVRLRRGPSEGSGLGVGAAVLGPEGAASRLCVFRGDGNDSQTGHRWPLMRWSDVVVCDWGEGSLTVSTMSADLTVTLLRRFDDVLGPHGVAPCVVLTDRGDSAWLGTSQPD